MQLPYKDGRDERRKKIVSLDNLNKLSFQNLRGRMKIKFCFDFDELDEGLIPFDMSLDILPV